MIRTKVEAHDHLAAMVELKQVESSDPEAFHSNNLDYLTARMQLRAGDLGRAAGYFQSVRSRNSILREYATWHLAAIAREQGNLFGERLLLLELLGDRPGSLLAHAVQQRIAQSYFETKNFDEAIAAVTAMIGQGAERIGASLSCCWRRHCCSKVMLQRHGPSSNRSSLRLRIRRNPTISRSMR